ncbi:DNA-methyltransferase Dcm [Opitutaceae bacterium TAV1]|nr:DNA-methyltransferase Dcm [Opitutaceae bacterium TAV1]
MKSFEPTAEQPAAGLTCVDIFSGAGGLAEGFRQAGFSIVSGSDIDSFASETFRFNFPESSFFEGDIAELSGQEILQSTDIADGEIDCLIGGPPCQAFSYNSHLRTHEGQVAGLFREYLRLVGELNPRYLVMENVPGILSVGDGGVVGEIASRLGELGYETDGRIVYAEDYGVPQQRRRMIFVASRIGLPANIFPVGTHGPSPKPVSNEHVHRWDPNPCDPPSRLVRVWSAIGDLPVTVSTTDESKALGYRTGAWCDFQRYAREGSLGVLNHHCAGLGPNSLARISHVPQGGSWRDIPRHLLPAGMQRARTSDHTKRYGRLAPKDLACTVLTKCDPHWGCYIHPNEDRVLTVREAARLQSFPDRFNFIGPQLAQYRLVGNSVPPLLARSIAQSIVAFNNAVVAEPPIQEAQAC